MARIIVEGRSKTMLDVSLCDKKILLLGGINTTADLIHLAHRNRVKVGVADYNKNTYVKGLADYVHDVSAVDEDAIVKLFINEGYDGIISAFNERLGPVVSRIGDKLQKPVPFTVNQLRMSTNKKYFKQMCIKYGVPVPKEYFITSIKDIRESDIDYPVIIKPVDGSSSVGVTPCYSAVELEKGFQKAKRLSKSGDVIVEQYLPYDEINLTYIAQNGDIQLAAIHDRYFNTTQKSATKAPDLYIYPSRYTPLFLQKYNNIILNMLKEIGIKNGSLFIQAIINGDELFCYEAGIRLNGCKTYQILEYENDFNTFERLMEFALTGSMGKKTHFNPRFKRWYATLNVLGQPGATIGGFGGIEALESYPWLIHIARRNRVGDTIPEDSAGTLVQDTTRIHLYADTKEELIERIDKVNELYKIYDLDGNNIILTPHDTQEVLHKLDYCL